MMTTSLRRSFVLAGVLALATTARIAVAQEDRPPADPRTVPELAPAFERAAQLGVPAGPLISTARKGYLWKVPVKDIRDGLQALAGRLAVAQAALAPVHGDDELAAGAEALRYNATPAMLKTLRAARRDRSIEVALGVLTELVAQGVKPQDAATKVATWLTAGATDGRIMAAAGAVAADVAAGLAPSRALAVRSQGVLSLLPAPVQGTAAPQRR